MSSSILSTHIFETSERGLMRGRTFALEKLSRDTGINIMARNVTAEDLSKIDSTNGSKGLTQLLDNNPAFAISKMVF